MICQFLKFFTQSLVAGTIFGSNFTKASITGRAAKVPQILLEKENGMEYVKTLWVKKTWWNGNIGFTLVSAYLLLAGQSWVLQLWTP